MKYKIYYTFLTALLLIIGAGKSRSQSLLEKNINIKVNNQRLGLVLKQIEEKGGFKLSYNSNNIRLDSIVNLYAEDVTVEEALNRVLNDKFEYKQTHDFIILRYAPFQLSLVLQESYNYSSQFVVKGQIVDKNTLRPVENASVYEKGLMQSTLTDADGQFTLRLRNFSQSINVTVSKENYKDISTIFLSEIVIKPHKENADGEYFDGDLSKVDKTWLGSLFISSKQSIQALNVGSFIAQMPVQFSLSPGLSTHGSLSGQIVNSFSLNATGGYSAGVDGIEIGLAFNIDRKDVRWFQFGGAFNLVGGDVGGLQIAGGYNNVLGGVKGVQVTLGYNRVMGDFNGVQIGGLYNKINHDLKGIQISPGYNVVKNDFNGIQIGLLNSTNNTLKGIKLGLAANYTKNNAQGLELAGITNYSKSFKGLRMALFGNIATKTAEGGQIAGVFNYAKRLKGFQVGLINIADTADGYNFGLLNLINKGYHKLSFSANETVELNAALKTGTSKFYTILMAGMNTDDTKKLRTFGLGFGKEYRFNSHLFLNPELSSSYLYQGDWEDLNLLNKFGINLTYRLNKYVELNAGPTLNVLYSDQTAQHKGYDFVWDKRKGFAFKDPQFKGWIGWNVGIAFF